HPLVDEFYQPDCVGLPKEGDNIHERNNRWALYSALTRGIDKVRLIAVWDGKGEVCTDLDAHLIKHMVDLMRDTGGMIEQINPMKLSRVISQNTMDAIHKRLSFMEDAPKTDSPKKPVPRRKKQ
ncbi:MAG TPA: hypothetical protein VKP08_06245, partial [Anaerolineales bacterium]|nr:hypothetical protein [Anaerolineales bacterium]